MSVYCTLFSQTFYGLLFCYLTITDVHVTLYLQIIDIQFPSCCASQPPKKLNQIITVNSSTNTPRSYHQKNNSCTLCVPMFKHAIKYNYKYFNYWNTTSWCFSVSICTHDRAVNKGRNQLHLLWLSM